MLRATVCPAFVRSGITVACMRAAGWTSAQACAFVQHASHTWHQSVARSKLTIQ